MARYHVEQISKQYARLGRKTARYWKRAAVRMMRRLSKLQREDAPQRIPFRGWTD